VVPKKADSKADGCESGPAELAADKKKLRELIDRAQDGEKGALPMLRRVLDEAPWLARDVDLARNVERSIIQNMSVDNVFTQEAIPRNLEAMRKEIAGENPSPLERLLAERIVLCWLELQYFETLYTQNIGDITLAQGDYHQRRIDKAHRRYLSSIKVQLDLNGALCLTCLSEGKG
jgi:hypothetical protein